MGVCVPERWGGAGLDYVSLALALEEIAAGDGATSTIVSVQNSVVCGPINAFGTDAQKERWLKPLLEGDPDNRDVLAAYREILLGHAPRVELAGRDIERVRLEDAGVSLEDLAKRLVALEETAFLSGSGTGQPLGILNTPGLSTTTYTEGTPLMRGLLAACRTFGWAMIISR